MVLFQVVLLVSWGFPRRISWDHRVRLVCVGGNLKAHLVSTPCHGQETRLDQAAAQGSVGMGQLCELDHSQSLLTGFCIGNISDLGLISSGGVLLFGAGLSQTLALTEPGGCFELGDERMVRAPWVRVMGFAPWAALQNCIAGKAEQPHPLVLPHSCLP